MGSNRQLLELQLKQLLLISLGAIPGSLMRWQINNNVIVNMLGSFFIGLLISLQVNSHKQLLLVIGFCGSLTTFSGWILISLNLLSNGHLIRAFLWLLIPLLCGLFAVAFGFFIGSTIRHLTLFQLLPLTLQKWVRQRF